MNGILKWKLYNFYRDKIIGWRSIYYSAFGEDAVVSAILNNKKNGFYVDVGAFHPEKYSNTKFFSKHLNWTGINIEPNQENYKLFLKRRKKDINLNLGVHLNESTLHYHRFIDGLYNTFDLETKNDLVKKGVELIGVDEIKVLPLKKILAEYLPANQAIDLLNIDVENLDLEVLKSNDWNKYRPEIIIIEDHELDRIGIDGNSKIVNFLKEQGYKLDSKCKFSLIFKNLK